MRVGPAVPKQNNFDLLRLVLALVVVLVHAYELSHLSGLKWLSDTLSSDFAVQSFFVVSGFLIFMSFDRSASISDYAMNRVRRIYPGYFAVVVLFAVALALISVRSVADFYLRDWWQYLAANLVFLNFLKPALPGVFRGNAINEVNGSLWTLKIEVMFYAFVPMAFALISRLGRRWVLSVLYAASIAYFVTCQWLSHQAHGELFAEVGRQLPGQLRFFLVGATFYLYFDFFHSRISTLVPLLVVVCGALSFTAAAVVVWPVVVGALIFLLAFFRYAGNFGRYGDFSYGVYIVHFPIIQIFIAAGMRSWGATAFLSCVVVATCIASFALWHLVERRYLAKRNHYVGSMTQGVVAAPSQS